MVFSRRFQHGHVSVERRARRCRHRLRRVRQLLLIHLLWAVGITWGLEEVSGGEGQLDTSIALTVVLLAAAAAGVAVIIITVGRVGWCKTPFSDRLLHIGAWLVFA
jgi:hypothetical protein